MLDSVDSYLIFRLQLLLPKRLHSIVTSLRENVSGASCSTFISACRFALFVFILILLIFTLLTHYLKL